MPAIFERTDERGDLFFLWPPQYALHRSMGSRYRFALRLHWDGWDWKPAKKCKFYTWCRRCYGHGAYSQPKGSKTKVACVKCGGYGVVPDRYPFGRKSRGKG